DIKVGGGGLPQGTGHGSKLSLVDGRYSFISMAGNIKIIGDIVYNDIYSYIQQKYQLTELTSIPSCIYPLITGGDFGNDNLDFQEYELIPASHVSFERSLTMASTIREKIQEVIEAKGGSVCTGPTGGFLPRMNNNSDVFELFLEAIKTTQYTFAQDLFFGLDAAADSLALDDSYRLRDKSDRYQPKDLMDFYRSLRERYKTIYLEDPFGGHDEKSWQSITENIGNTTKIVADEFILSDKEKLEKAIKHKHANALCIKLLDKGTISETLQIAKIARDAEWTIVVSEHSGETNETLLTDLAVGIGADYVKLGPPNRGERIAKYNRLIEINEEINPPEKI
ncbi:MAG: Enolase, partial [Microgenomates bacterium 39_7]